MLRARIILFLLLLAGVAAGAWLWRSMRRETLVVYCAHDAIYSEQILRQFERETGIAVAIRFDTEATKSLGLVELITRESNAPRCDVFWNNELLGMLDLQERGLLEPYRGSGFARMPAAFKNADGLWCGFAARLRVIIYNTDQLGEAATPDKIAALLQAPNLANVAIARPLFGTTLTHYTVLWSREGAEKLQVLDRDLRQRGIREVGGNAAVKDLVASGACAFGFSDTDDFFEGKDAGKPLAILPLRLAGDATICIPNSVAIIRGTHRRVAAEQLIDFLLSEKTELALARSASRQIPLGPTAANQLPREVRELQGWAADGVPLTGLGPARKECLAWLKSREAR